MASNLWAILRSCSKNTIKDTISSDRDTSFNDKNTISNDKDTISSDKDTISSDKDTISSDKDTISSDKDTISNDKDTSSKDKDTISSDRDTDSDDQDTIFGDNNTTPYVGGNDDEDYATVWLELGHATRAKHLSRFWGCFKARHGCGSLNRNVISERLAAKIPSQLIDRTDRTPIRTIGPAVESRGKVRLQLRASATNIRLKGDFHILDTSSIEHGKTIRIGDEGPTNYDAMIMGYLPMHDYTFQQMRMTGNSMLGLQDVYEMTGSGLSRWNEIYSEEDAAHLVKTLLIRPQTKWEWKLARRVVDVMLRKWNSLEDLAKVASETNDKDGLVDRQLTWLLLSVKMTNEGCASDESEQHEGELIRLENCLCYNWGWERDDVQSASEYACDEL